MNKMKQYYLKTREIFLKKQSLLKLIAAGFLAVVLVGLVLSHMEFYYCDTDNFAYPRLVRQGCADFSGGGIYYRAVSGGKIGAGLGGV